LAVKSSPITSAQVVVDRARIHRLHLARVVAVLEQGLTRQLLHAAHQRAQPTVTDHHLLQLPGLAPEAHAHPATPKQVQVTVAQRCQAVRLVLLRIGFIAHPHQRVGQQRDHHRQHLLARETAALEVAAQAPPQRWQRLAEGDGAVELAGVANGRPVGVVAVLFAPARVAAGGLQVAIGAGTDPHGGIGRWNGQRADALQGGGIAHGMTIGIAIGKTLAGADAAETGLGVIDVAQAGGARGLAFGCGGRWHACSLPIGAAWPRQ